MNEEIINGQEPRYERWLPDVESLTQKDKTKIMENTMNTVVEILLDLTLC